MDNRSKELLQNRDSTNSQYTHSVNTTLGMVSLTSLASVSARRVNTMDNASYVNIYFMQA